MSEHEQNKPLGELARVLRCDEWENLLADALDGTLSAADAAALRERAPGRIRERYTWDGIADSYDRLFHSVASESRRAPELRHAGS